MDSPILNLSVTAAEAQTILDALGELPHKRVGTLSIKLQSQAQEQLDKFARGQMEQSMLNPMGVAVASQGMQNGADTSQI
jgi:phosphoribosylformylglycinamidine (FGAM) synthase PurS component